MILTAYHAFLLVQHEMNTCGHLTHMCSVLFLGPSRDFSASPYAIWRKKGGNVRAPPYCPTSGGCALIVRHAEVFRSTIREQRASCPAYVLKLARSWDDTLAVKDEYDLDSIQVE